MPSAKNKRLFLFFERSTLWIADRKESILTSNFN
jgi:hypothetical protein